MVAGQKIKSSQPSATPTDKSEGRSDLIASRLAPTVDWAPSWDLRYYSAGGISFASRSATFA